MNFLKEETEFLKINKPWNTKLEFALLVDHRFKTSRIELSSNFKCEDDSIGALHKEINLVNSLVNITIGIGIKQCTLKCLINKTNSQIKFTPIKRVGDGIKPLLPLVTIA